MTRRDAALLRGWLGHLAAPWLAARPARRTDRLIAVRVVNAVMGEHTGTVREQTSPLHGSGHLKVLFVCMGNICRSPAALIVAQTLAQRAALIDAFTFDSAGTHGYHVGEAPYGRMQIASARRGYDLPGVRARKVAAADFAAFDLILAMDGANLVDLERICAAEHRWLPRPVPQLCRRLRRSGGAGSLRRR